MNFAPVHRDRRMFAQFGSWRPVDLITWEPTPGQFANATAIFENYGLERPQIQAWGDISERGPVVHGLDTQGTFPGVESNGIVPMYSFRPTQDKGHVSFGPAVWNSHQNVVGNR